jgi:hypothetical protein
VGLGRRQQTFGMMLATLTFTSKGKVVEVETRLSTKP